jgi:hypothetical protein
LLPIMLIESGSRIARTCASVIPGASDFDNVEIGIRVSPGAGALHPAKMAMLAAHTTSLRLNMLPPP